MNDTTGTTSSTRYDTADVLAGDEKHSLQTYVSDMLALERHINAPISKQLADKDANNYPEAMTLISNLKTVTENHISALEAQLKTLGGHAGSPIKSAWSGLLGAGAAVVDSVRKTRVSKNLRDDNTALSLATTGYTMLHATACGLGDTATASLAQRHLNDLTPIIMQISHVLPQVVLRELQDDGESVDVSAASQTQAVVGQAWNQPSRSQTGGSF